MTKRRLNKKVALIGSAVVLFFLLVVIVAIRHFGRGPDEFIVHAEAALKEAREATDDQIKEQNYERAARNFRSAYGRAKTDQLREEVLFKMVDMYLETNDWSYVRGCWDEIIKVNPNNAKARYGLLKFFYILADTGAGFARYWQNVYDQASDFLEVAEDEGLLREDTAEWDVFESEHEDAGRQPLGPYLYLARGRAALEMASLGTVTDRDKSLAQAVEDFKKVQEFEPNNVDAYWHLANTELTKGQIFASRADFEGRDRSTKQALAFLEQAVEIADSDPIAHINLLELKLTLARRSGSAQQKQQIQSLEPEFVELKDRFGSSPDALLAVSKFYAVYSMYSGPELGAKNLDKAVEAVEEAVRLDPENVSYAISSADLHYRRFSVYGRQGDIDKSIEIAKKALTLPAAQDTPGPRKGTNIENRHYLCSYLAHFYTEQILESDEPETSPQVQTWLAGAAEAVREIEQIHGSGENPRVVKWRGMLELAQGNEQAAIRKLYTAYEQRKAVKPPDQARWQADPPFAQLSYRLAKLFKDTSEIGAVNEFLISAILSGIDATKPEARLDFVEVLLKFYRSNDAKKNIDYFEDYSGPTRRSQNLRVRMHIDKGEFDEAEKELARRPEGDPDVIRLRLASTQARIRQIVLAIKQKQIREDQTPILPGAGLGQEASDDSQANIEQFMTSELKGYRQLEAELVEKLLPIDPNAVEQDSVVSVCRTYVVQGQVSRARNLVDRFLGYFPDNTQILIYKQILAEPNPTEVAQERLSEIEQQVLSGISDPISRATQLGAFYRRHNQADEAIAQFKKALESGASQELTPGSPDFKQTALAASYLFDAAIGADDWQLAEQVADAARDGDFDGCGGQIFATRLAVAKGEFKDALARIDDCLKQKPVFSQAYMLRSNINGALGDEHASLEDIRKASSLNPLDRTISRGVASALYRRNQKLGDNASVAEIAEAREALEAAIRLNPQDLGLLNSYAEYIAPTEPLRAVAIRQDINKAVPTLNNALLLGTLAMEVAARQTNTERKETLLAVAGSAFDQARQMDPANKQMLYHYAEYLRTVGEGEKAKQLLEDSQDEKLLWDHYFRAGQYSDARKILEQLYESGTIDSTVLRGLLLVVEKTSDKEAVKKYSEELISLEDSVQNNLAQVQAFLRVGLVKEAEYKLQSAKEKYPNEPTILLLEAWLAMRQGQLTKALELTNKNLQSNPDNAIAWRLKGEINFFRTDYGQAISDLRKSKLLSDEPATRISLAKAYLGMERYEDAITELKNAIDAPGAPLEARSLLEHILFQLDRKQALKRFYEETLQKFPDSSRWLNRAGAFAVRMGEFDRAEQLYRKSFLARRQLHLDSNSNNEIQDILYATAFDGYLKSLLAGAGAPNQRIWNPSKLGRVFEECKKYENSVFAPIAYLRMAQAKLTLGDRATAIEYCRKAVDKAGTNETLASEVLLRMYLILGPNEVMKYCEQKLSTNPGSLAANFTMFNLAKINGQYDEAIDYVNKCIELSDPDSSRRVDYVIKKAEILILAHDRSSDKNYLRTAIADYESLLAKMPNNTSVTSVLNNLAYLLAEINERLPEAVQYARRALDSKPNDPGFLDTYAYVLHKNGEDRQAAEFLEAALQQYGQNEVSVPAEVYEHKGMIKEKLGAKGEALAAYRTALDAGADRLSQKSKQRIKEAIERISP